MRQGVPLAVRDGLAILFIQDLLRFNFFSCNYDELQEMARLVAPERLVRLRLLMRFLRRDKRFEAAKSSTLDLLDIRP